MDIKHIQRTGGYLLLIWIGWLAGEYPHIPSFTLGFIRHLQPSIEVYDKCIATTLLAFSLALLFALWHNIWLMISMVFIVCGMFNNFVDEIGGTASYLNTNEQILLLFALLTTSILIWKRHRK